MSNEMHTIFEETTATIETKTDYILTHKKPAHVVIVDIDGTLSIRVDRTPYEFDKVLTDIPNEPIVELVRSLPFMIFYMSGRPESCREDTVAWIKKQNLPFGALLMRETGDNRKDAIIKRELYEKHFGGELGKIMKVIFVLDDRDSVVFMWRHELGLCCLQCAEGNF